MNPQRSIQMVFRMLLMIAGIPVVCFWAGDAHAAQMPAENSHVKSVAAIAEVVGNGQVITAAVLEYDTDIVSSTLSPATFSVDGRTVTKVYANSEAARSPRGVDGRYAVIELSPADGGARSFLQNGPSFTRAQIAVSVTQTGDIVTTGGETYAPNAAVMTNDRSIQPVVDDFGQFEFRDAQTGETLKYNLFVPKKYDAKKSYPMVMFIPDAAAISEETDTPLVQGLGAVIWATPSEQAKHECFVLAPQFTTRGTDNARRHDTLVHLVKDVSGRYSIDRNRLYTTGQSMGCMLSIAIAIKHPDLFAASLLVAGQWDADAMAVLADKKMWIIVSEGDTRAFPGMNASLAVMEGAGAKISRAVWDARAEAAETAANVKKMAAEDTDIKYTVFEKGTTLPENEANSGRNEHMQTWWIAYGIEGVRDWLFEQKKTSAEEVIHLPAGVIPPPDESHASHDIGVCGDRHYEPRMEFCDPRDNTVYRYVTIGTQTWMAENLNYGKMIPGSQDQSEPGRKYCLHDREENCAALYQWAQVVGLEASYNEKIADLNGPVQGICPVGWHVPGAAEWDTLLSFVDREQGLANESISLMVQSHDDDFKWKTNTSPDNMIPTRDLYGFGIISTGQRVRRGTCPDGLPNDSWFCNAHDVAMFWTSDDGPTGSDPGAAVNVTLYEEATHLTIHSKDDSITNRADKAEMEMLAELAARKAAEQSQLQRSYKPSRKYQGMAVRCVKD